jgi:hypothetical protein
MVEAAALTAVFWACAQNDQQPGDSTKKRPAHFLSRQQFHWRSSSLRKRAGHAVGSAIDFVAASEGDRLGGGYGQDCNSEVEKK